MYLNDAFDAEIDAAERSNRPIPTGKISVGKVWSMGWLMLLAGSCIGFFLGWKAGLAGLGLAGSVVLYDCCTKGPF